MIALVILLSVIFVIFAAYLFFRSHQHKYDDFVLQNSLCLKQLKKINDCYKFNPDVNFDQTHTYDNENSFNTITCQDFLIYQLQYIGKKVNEQIKKISENRQKYLNYLNEVNEISDFGKFQVPAQRLSIEKLIKREKRCFQKNILAKPSTQFRSTITLYRSDIHGNIHEKKSDVFDSNAICALIKRLNNKRGSFYNDRGIWDAICRVERGKVSNQMRFAIYKRDGYKCRHCGISQKYTNLEIDHIIPIAKGGKSTFDNLQTLCHKCNLEKGDKIL